MLPTLPEPLAAAIKPALEASSRAARPDVQAALDLAARLTDLVPPPAGGRTAQRWSLLAALGAGDLTVARVVEAHLDAVAILTEADQDGVGPAKPPPPGATWGVFAAEAPQARLEAVADGEGWLLRGTKPWCSLAGRLSHALVTAHVGEGRQLFATALDHAGVHVQPGMWRSRGLADVPSGPVDFDDVPAWPVGPPACHLRRPGFAHGGIGVAACWFGGAVGVARSMAAAASRRPPDQIAAWHLGEADLALHGASTVLAAAAEQVDGGGAAGVAGEVLALRARSTVAAAAEEVLRRAGHALGPAPLALDELHARRVADLTVYLRQHHAERDVARLGELVLAEGPTW